VIVGVGCSRGCPAGELLALVDGALADAGASPASVSALATIDVRGTEPGVVAAAQARGWPIATHPAAALRDVPVPTPSATVAAHVGTPSVAEAAALLTAGAGSALRVTKRRSAHATCAIAEGAPG
jgi:cobalamin biosynthesis protein CbiG